jgi:DNA-binding response OmpR family regulator
MPRRAGPRRTAADAHGAVNAASPPMTAPPHPPRRILFIEDNDDLRGAYERFFAGRHAIAFAASGADALTEFDAFHPDVVVLDLQLPDTDGFEVLRTIRDRNARVPVIITTAFASMEPIAELMGIDLSGYLIKPYSLHDLAERIDAVG